MDLFIYYLLISLLNTVFSIETNKSCHAVYIQRTNKIKLINLQNSKTIMMNIPCLKSFLEGKTTKTFLYYL